MVIFLPVHKDEFTGCQLRPYQSQFKNRRGVERSHWFQVTQKIDA